MFRQFARGISGILDLDSTGVRGLVGLMLTLPESPTASLWPLWSKLNRPALDAVCNKIQASPTQPAFHSFGSTSPVSACQDTMKFDVS